MRGDWRREKGRGDSGVAESLPKLCVRLLGRRRADWREAV